MKAKAKRRKPKRPAKLAGPPPAETQLATTAAPAEIITIPDPPAHLDEEARREWSRVAPLLQGMGMDLHANRAPLAIYCVNWSRWVKAELSIIESGGEIVRSPAGFPVQNPWLGIGDRAQGQLQQAARSFK